MIRQDLQLNGPEHVIGEVYLEQMSTGLIRIPSTLEVKEQGSSAIGNYRH